MILAIIAIFTMTLGNLGALMQRSVPRILAYSSIAQAGYIMIGLGSCTVYGPGTYRIAIPYNESCSNEVCSHSLRSPQ